MWLQTFRFREIYKQREVYISKTTYQLMKEYMKRNKLTKTDYLIDLKQENGKPYKALDTHS